MPPDDDDQTNTTVPVEDDSPGDPPAAAAAALTADAVRNSPEYKELARQNRQLARQAGQAQREALQARTAAEQARQAAEAQQQTELEDELASILGAENIDAYNELAALTQSDPKAAAKQMAQLMASRRAQSQPESQTPPPDEAAAPEGGSTAVASASPPPSRGVGADAPLGQQPPSQDDDYAAVAAGLDQNFQSIVDRVQNPDTRRRVTMRDRGAGMIAFLGSALIRKGARPSNQR